MNERLYPNIVGLPVPFGGFRDTSFEIDAFHRDRKLQSKYARGRNDEGQWYVRYCFADMTIADAFRISSAASV